MEITLTFPRIDAQYGGNIMEKLINAKVDTGRLGLMWLGGGGFVLKPHSGDVIAVDPDFSSNTNNSNGTRSNGAHGKSHGLVADYLFLTHDHPETTDIDSVSQILQRNSDLRVICPPSCCPLLARIGVPNRQIDSITAGQHLEFPHFSAHAVPALHTEDSVGYVFEFDEQEASPAEVSLYFAGHTVFDQSLASSVADFGPDVLILPISGQHGNMDAEDAARLTAIIAPEEVIPVYDHNDETVDTFDTFSSHVATMAAASDNITPVDLRVNACHIFCPQSVVAGRHGKKQARAERARTARRSHQHNDGLRGANHGSGGRVAR